ncbi:MAG: hypothetical protein ACI4TM_11480 [Candidatus Cryptobacteroides sp.]
MERKSLLDDVMLNVKAYRRLLEMETGHAKLPEHFEDLPLLTKQNYLLEYPLEDLCRENDLDNIHLIGSSSGFSKTGAVYWPKRPCDEAGYMKAIEQMFIDTAGIDQKKTLIVECLAFGLWIGGMQIAAAIRNIALSGRYRLTIATPGLDLKAAVNVIKAYHRLYDQVLIITNPSNIPLITALAGDDMELRCGGKVSFPVVGEYFTEAFREQTAKSFGHKEDEPFVVWTGYGSADTGDLGVETASTIALRKYFHHNPSLSEKIFGTSSTPMILAASGAAYFEIIEGNIVVTKDQFIPLIRYNTKDAGGLLSKNDVKDLVPSELFASLPENMIYVYGRADNAVIFYGTNLIVNDIQDFFLSLPKSAGYGGLFSVRENVSDGVSSFDFTIFTVEEHASEDFFLNELLNYLCNSSAEFNIKYQNLSKSAPRPLVSVRFKPITEIGAMTKHRFIES